MLTTVRREPLGRRKKAGENPGSGMPAREDLFSKDDEGGMNE